MRQNVLIAVGILLSALFLWLALRSVETQALWAALGAADLIWLAPFLLSLAAFCWLKAVRWSLLLDAACDADARRLIAPVVIGYMGTGLMPMQLGEVARAYLAARALDTRLATVLASLFVERILDVFVLLVLIAFVGGLGVELGPEYRAIGALFALLAALAGLALWLFAAHTKKFIALVERVIVLAPQSVRAQLVDQLQAGARGVQFLRRPSQYWRLAGLSLLQWSCMCACTWISIAAIGEYAPPAAALAVLATTIVSMTLPAGPGYVGALQLAYVLALAPFGVDRADALAASFFYLAALWAPLVACGLFLLNRMGLELRSFARSTITREPG